MSQSRVNRGGLQIAAQLDAFVADQVAPGTGVSVEAFWTGFETCLKELGPVNRELLAVRESLLVPLRPAKYNARVLAQLRTGDEEQQMRAAAIRQV